MAHDVRSKLVDAILRHIEAVEHYCASADVSPNTSVHELRKMFKRLRALTRLCEHQYGRSGKPIRAGFKQFGKLLSPLRESYINACLFERILVGSRIIPEPGIKKVEERLRLKNRSLLESGFGEQDICGLIRNFFAGLEPELESLGNSRFSGFDIIRELNSSYAGSYTFFNSMPVDVSSEKLHALRKRTKRLYYQLEFIQFSDPGHFKPRIEQLDPVNDLLGNDHDFSVFFQEMRSPDYGLDPEETIVLENRVDQLRERNRLELRPLLARFFSESPEEFGWKLEQVVRS